MISKLFYSLVFIKLLQISALADAKIYTVFVCSDKTYEQAFSDKNHYIKYPKADTFIIRSKAGPYRVAYGKFKHIGDAEVFRKTLPEELKKLNPYVEKLTEEYYGIATKRNNTLLMDKINNQSLDVASIMIRIGKYHNTSISQILNGGVFLILLKTEYFLEIIDFLIFKKLGGSCITNIE